MDTKLIELAHNMIPTQMWLSFFNFEIDWLAILYSIPTSHLLERMENLTFFKLYHGKKSTD